MAGSSKKAGTKLLDAILTSLNDDKAEDVVTIPLKGKSEIADHMVICSGRSTRQVASIADKLVQKVKDRTGQTPRTEGKDAGVITRSDLLRTVIEGTEVS